MDEDKLRELYSKLDATIREIVADYAGHPEQAVRALIDAANDAGGKDNVTAVYVEGPAFAERVRRAIPAADAAPGPPPAPSLERSIRVTPDPPPAPRRRQAPEGRAARR